MENLRAELEKVPERMSGLPIHRGYPVPWFVDHLPDGTPEFRAMDGRKWVRAYKERLCWVCGQKLGRNLAFLIGPMCALNRTTAEPPCHLECAEWSARSCPFLSRPHMVRREGDELAEAMKGNVAGVSIRRNPGVSLIWVTTYYKVFQDEAGRPLIEIGDQHSISWWSEGRPATRAEVKHSIATGLPLLEATIEQEEPKDRAAARRELSARLVAALALLPEEKATAHA